MGSYLIRRNFLAQPIHITNIWLNRPVSSLEVDEIPCALLLRRREGATTMHRSRTVGVAVTVGVTSLVACPASAVASNRPAVVMDAPATTVAQPNVTITYTANRAGDQLAPEGLTCLLSGPVSFSDCGTVTTAKHSLTGTVDLTGLRSGTYSYTVKIVPSDGGQAAASSSFVIVDGQDFAGLTTCEGFGGVFTAGTSGGIWECDDVLTTDYADYVTKFTELSTACLGQDGGQ